MKIANMDTMIAIEQPITVKDSVGQSTITWQPFKMCYASVFFGGGSEGRVGEQKVATSTVKFTIRHVADMYATFRIKLGADLYDIKSIAPLERRKYLLIEAIKRDNGK